MKNPAVLWYPSDFIAATIFWNNEQCGAYIRLLNCQFTLGHLSMDQMKSITNDEIVLSKFVKDKSGKYYNERLEKEIEKRQKYSESRSKNKLGKTKSYDNHMKNISKSHENHMGNININENININIIDYFNNNIHSIVPKEYEELTKWEEYFTDDIIINAIDIAVLNNAKSMNYINAILRDWKSKGYKTINDIPDKKSKDIPKWLNEEIEEEKSLITDEERKEYGII